MPHLTHPSLPLCLAITRTSAPRLLTLLLSMFLFQGCATPTTVTESTAPLHDRLTLLEGRLDTALQGLQATQGQQQSALERAQTTHAERLDQFAQQLSQQRAADSAAQQATQTAQADLARQINTLGAQLDRQAQSLDSRQADAAGRLRDELQQRMDMQLRGIDQSQSGRIAALEKRLDDVARMAEEALAAMGLGPRKILGKVVHSNTLTEDRTLFPLNSPELGPGDKAKLDAIADYVKKLDVNYHIAIHGHTDGFGSDDYNYELGKARAEVVKRYLHEQRQIPLLRMSVISHGAVGAGSTYREGANRRIVVQVLQ